MRVNKIRAVGGYRKKHQSASKPSELVPNVLLRNFDVTSPCKARLTDITYIRTWQGWLYPAVVMDLFSRMIIGRATNLPRARTRRDPDGSAAATPQPNDHSLGPGHSTVAAVHVAGAGA